MSISNIIDPVSRQIFPPLIPQSAVGVLSITGQAPSITIGGTAQNPIVQYTQQPLTNNGIAVFTLSPASTQNTLSGGIGPLVQFAFASLTSSSGIGSSFSVNGGEVVWGGTSDIAITFTVPITFNTTLTAGGVEEFTSVNPIDGGLPASGANPPFLNLYTHSGLVFVFQTLNALGNVINEIAQGCASGFLVNIGEYSANISYTTFMKPTDKILLNLYSNSAFNQNWNGGPNAGEYTITASSLPVVIYAVECPIP